MIRMHHPNLDDATTDAVSEDQAAHLETLGWERTPPPDPDADAPAEVYEDTVVGTTSSLGDEVVVVEAPDAPPVPPEGTVDEVLAWVDQGTDGWRARAQAAIAAEDASEHPRKGIIEPLTAALNPED